MNMKAEAFHEGRRGIPRRLERYSMNVGEEFHEHDESVVSTWTWSGICIQ